MFSSVRRFRLAPATVLAAGAAVWTGCGSGADLGISSVLVVASVEVTPASITLVQQQIHTFVATARTSSGVPVTGRAVAWSSSDPGVASVGPDGMVTAIAPGITRVTARVDEVSGFSDLTVSIIPIDHLEVAPVAPEVIVGSTVQLAATAYDADGEVLTDRPLTWNSSQVLIATVSGEGLVTTHGVGKVTITASAEGKSAASTVTAQARPAAKLGFLTPPSNAAAGAPIAPAVSVAIQDETGARVFAATNTVTLALGGTGGATLGGTVSADAVEGVATFANLSITKAGAGYTLVASSTGLTSATSATFAIQPAAASKLVIIGPPPSEATSGSPLVPQPVLQLADQFSNPVAQAGVAVAASIASGNALLTGAGATTASNGAATFSGLTIAGAPGTVALGFSSSGLTSATSSSITLKAGAPNQLALTSPPPASATNGQPFASPVVVALRDAGGNPMPQAGLAITVAIGSGGGTLTGPSLTSSTDAAGTASFPGLVITGPVGPYTLTFSGTGINTLTSGPIQLTAGPAAKLVLAVAPPATAAAGVPLSPAPAVQVGDISGNPVSVSGVQVTATLASGTGVLTGANAVTNPAGLATFSALTIVGLPGNYTLSFNAPSLTGVTSGTIAITAGAPAQLTFNEPAPANAINGQPLSPAPELQLRDATGLAVPQSGVTISVTIASGSGGTLTGTLSATTNEGGAASFPNLAITGSVGEYTLSFSAPGTPAAISNKITLAAGAPAGMTFATAPPANAGNGVPLSPQPVIQLVDISGNAAGPAGVGITASLAPNSGTLTGTLAVATNDAGRGTYSNLTISGAQGSYTLTFASTGLPDLVSAGIQLGAGTPTGIAIATQPSSSAQNDEAFSQQPVVVVTDASSNPVAGVTVTASIASGPSGTKTLGGTLTAITTASGAAAFTGLEIVGPVGSYTLRFSAAGLNVISGTVGLVPGAVTQLVITVQPTDVDVGDAISPAPRVQLRDSGNNLVPESGRLVSVSISSGNGTLNPLSTLIVTTSNGVGIFTNVRFLLKGGGNGDHRLQFSSFGLSVISSKFEVED